MKKLIHSASYGLFYSSPATYDEKTVYDIEEAINMNANEGWSFDNFNETFAGLGLNLYRDLKKNKPN